MPGVETISNWRNELILKALYGSVFVAEEDVPLLDTAALFDAEGEIQPLPVDWQDVGYINTDGASFPRETENSDINSWQSTEPTRSDLTTDTSSASWVMQETNPISLGVYEDIPFDELGLVGESWTWDKPANPLGLYRRYLFVAQDNYQGLPIYIVKMFPRGKVTEREDETQNRENAIERGVTVTAYRDSSIGTSVRAWVDGPGWRALASGS
jgi:hypothetical protein